jgi:hypothetical protein
MQRVGIGEDNPRRALDPVPVCRRCVAVVRRGLQLQVAGGLDVVKLLQLVVGECLEGIEVEGTAARVIV